MTNFAENLQRLTEIALKNTPKYLIESSWEVCNKVGGIYTVLSSQARVLKEHFSDRLIFIGPDLHQGKDEGFVEEDVYPSFREYLHSQRQISVRCGRWAVPGAPVVFLVDFSGFYVHRNQIYGFMWENFMVDSLHAYGDYHDASMFAFAVGKVTEAFYHFEHIQEEELIFHGHEWMLGMAVLYLKKAVPGIATVFTTHATTVGRSICYNGKQLYKYFQGYFGDQMASELNVECKHSVEKQTAHHADCFTTVSDITSMECSQLLEKPADVVTLNGFDASFVPDARQYRSQRIKARKSILDMAGALTGRVFSSETLIVGTSGRYEFHNKGIDLLLESLAMLDGQPLDKDVLVLISVPAWRKNAREDLKKRLENGFWPLEPLACPVLTHELNEPENDPVLGKLRSLGLDNAPLRHVCVIFLPAYLDGGDGILDMDYYEMLPGLDLSVYPSYYEPWGYTPLESIAFHVPTITTNLAGFGLWAKEMTSGSDLRSGVKVIERTDDNYEASAREIAETVRDYASLGQAARNSARRSASVLSQKALWKDFIQMYFRAYDFAIEKKSQRK